MILLTKNAESLIGGVWKNDAGKERDQGTGKPEENGHQKDARFDRQARKF
jgi:hypothetical protein